MPDSAGLETPIHIFGSLDTVTTPMYFLAGADIFDGLTWLRFVFHDGYTIYKQNYCALELGVRTPSSVIDAKCWHQNYYYMKELEDEMRRFSVKQRIFVISVPQRKTGDGLSERSGSGGLDGRQRRRWAISLSKPRDTAQPRSGSRGQGQGCGL